MRKKYLFLFLALCLLFAQHGAALHALDHGLGALAQTHTLAGQADDNDHAPGLLADCLVWHGLDLAGAGWTPPDFVTSALIPSRTLALPAWVFLALPAPVARAPPFTLA